MKTIIHKNRISNLRAFTLVELLMALMVTSVILAAVASLTFAVGAANDATDDTLTKQAQLRYTSLRLGDLIKNSKLICGISTVDLAIWLGDANSDGIINAPELVYIECGDDGDYIKLIEFIAKNAAQEIWEVETAWIMAGGFKDFLIEDFDTQESLLIPQCSNVTYAVDVAPKDTKFVTISFDLTENESTNNYEINASLRCWGGNLLSSSFAIVTDDD